MTNSIIAAHPDDEALVCRGVIKKYSDKEDFNVLILTGGADTRYEKSIEKVLRENALETNRLLGTKEVFLKIYQTKRWIIYLSWKLHKLLKNIYII